MEHDDIIRAMNAHVDQLMAVPGVAAVAVGELADGTPCIRVYVVEKTPGHGVLIHGEIEGYPVDVEESGEIRPMEEDDG
ncbi:MAG: hypothetical protein PHQ19_02115 [Candidatus Krumholzibacteria bacterium]|nr:hypothetical protein [Candidatus Krumholzibacteria bacterium]